MWHLTNKSVKKRYICIMSRHYTNKQFNYICISIILWLLTKKSCKTIYICNMLGHFTNLLLKYISMIIWHRANKNIISASCYCTLPINNLHYNNMALNQKILKKKKICIMLGHFTNRLLKYFCMMIWNLTIKLLCICIFNSIYQQTLAASHNMALNQQIVPKNI